MKKYLLFLLTLFVIWLFVISVLLFNLKKEEVKKRDYPYEICKIKLSDILELPILLNKDNGRTYMYSIKNFAWLPIDFRLKDIPYVKTTANSDD